MPTFSRYEISNPTGFESVKLVKGLEIPTPAHGQVLVKVHAVSLNYRDLIIARGEYPSGIKKDVRSRSLRSRTSEKNLEIDGCLMSLRLLDFVSRLPWI
jgi:hypothetical protein